MTITGIAIPQRIADEDARLRGIVTTKQAEAADAQLRLDQYRWEQVRCPDGPKFGVREYARAVGLQHPAILQSLSAWEEGGIASNTTCGFGRPHPLRAEQPGVDEVESDGRSAEDHQRNRVKAKHKGKEADAIEAVAERLDVTVPTATRHHIPVWKDVLGRAEDYAGDEGIEVERSHIDRAADIVVAEREARERDRELVRAALKKMKQPYSSDDVDGYLKTATQRSERKGISIAQAIDELMAELKASLDAASDEKARLAARIKLVRDLERDLTNMESSGRRLEVTLTENHEELGLEQEDQDKILALVTQIRSILDWIDLALSDTSRVDWDAEVIRVLGGTSK